MKHKSGWGDWVAVIVGSIFIIRGSEAVLRLIRAGERVKETRQELVEAKKTNEELRAKLDEVNSNEFVEREAREKLGYGREGEVILILPEQKTDGTKENNTNVKPVWKMWWDLYIKI
jgi:cell division protein FtsB